MSSLAESVTRPVATTVHVTEDNLTVELRDGRTVSVPVMWYPRLNHATADVRRGWELIGGGSGIHWEAVDEDISVEALLEGKGSNESQDSLRRWLNTRGV